MSNLEQRVSDLEEFIVHLTDALRMNGISVPPPDGSHIVVPDGPHIASPLNQPRRPKE